MMKKPRSRHEDEPSETEDPVAETAVAEQVTAAPEPEPERPPTEPPTEPPPVSAVIPLPDHAPSGKFGVVLITPRMVRLFVPPSGGWIDYDAALRWSKDHYSEGEMYHITAIESAP